MKILASALGIIILTIACSKEGNDEIGYDGQQPYVLKIPPGFDVPVIPEDNALTGNRVLLGRKLFYDAILSKDMTRSCGSCHVPHLAFSDSTAVSFGIDGRPGTRNTPSLTNVVYQKALLREGGVPTLEMQIFVPIQEHNEFDFNILEVADRMKSIPEYVKLSQLGYNRAPDPFVITRAIAAFERTLISGESPFDKWYYQKDQTAVTESVKRGFALFTSDRLNCSQCHSGFLMTNQGYSNNGLYEVYADSGKMRLTGLETDRALFKVPGLRNIALTAPYMHDGSMPDLNSVIDHYESGGKNNVQKSREIKAFQLNAEERSDLIAFLNSLTDENFIKNPKFQRP